MGGLLKGTSISAMPAPRNDIGKLGPQKLSCIRRTQHHRTRGRCAVVNQRVLELFPGRETPLTACLVLRAATITGPLHGNQPILSNFVADLAARGVLSVIMEGTCSDDVSAYRAPTNSFSWS